MTNYQSKQETPPDKNAFLAEELNHFCTCLETTGPDDGATPPHVGTTDILTA